PAHDLPVRIEHENRIVDDAFHHEAKALLAALQLLFRNLPPRQVPRDLGEAAQGPGFVAQRRRQRERPEGRAVAAHAPAFALVPSFSRRQLERALRLPALDILHRVKAREGAADDFRGCIALDLLSALVPAGHPSFRVEQENGVVLDAVEQGAEALLRLLQQLLRALAPLDVLAQRAVRALELARPLLDAQFELGLSP